MEYAVIRHADSASGSEQISTTASATNENVNDWILRLQQSSNQHATYTLIPTENIISPFLHIIDENSLLRGVIKNLWDVYKYQQEYQSFLLGGCEEKEFLEIAEKYAASFHRIPSETLIWAASVLLNVLDNYLTSSDLSTLLNVDPSDVEHALRSSSNIHAVSLESQETHGEQR
jgi:hypothetical protein